jgi:tRNA-2-methylthio-N6-dimethylallyladenosine synthase
MNVADSDLVSSLLGQSGYRAADSPADADVIVINTCAVRERAEERVFARARELSGEKRRREGVLLAVIGCMAEHLKGELLRRAPYVDVIAGPDTYRRLPALLEQARSANAQGHESAHTAADTLIDVALDKSETYEGLSSAEGGDGVSGFITIQRGCDKFCTFCVVPFTRGRERGVPPREVLRQARTYAEAGYRELVLLGQTVNSYRYEQADFADLLRAVAAIDGIERIRFTSPYPVDFTAAVIEAIATQPKVCKYVHLPLQSGSDIVLERMRRGYRVADFRALTNALRAAIPDLAISTDILSGFAGETEDDHRATLELMRELRFDSAFMFSYSERTPTYASRHLPDDVSAAEKQRRLAEIIALQEQISREIFSAQVGRCEPVLIHGESRRNPAELVGRTDGFKSVILPRGDLRAGDLVNVRIERATMATLFGQPVYETVNVG